MRHLAKRWVRAVPNIGAKETLEHIGVMRFELENWLQVCCVTSIFHSPDVAISLAIVNRRSNQNQNHSKPKFAGNGWESHLAVGGNQKRAVSSH